jgi:hypothetical protein
MQCNDYVYRCTTCATAPLYEMESCLTCLYKSDCNMMLKSEVQRMTRVSAMQYLGNQGGLACKKHTYHVQQESNNSEVTKDA